MKDLRQWAIALRVREAQRRLVAARPAGLASYEEFCRVNRIIFLLVMARPFPE